MTSAKGTQRSQPSGNSKVMAAIMGNPKSKTPKKPEMHNSKFKIAGQCCRSRAGDSAPYRIDWWLIVNGVPYFSESFSKYFWIRLR